MPKLAWAHAVGPRRLNAVGAESPCQTPDGPPRRWRRGRPWGRWPRNPTRAPRSRATRPRRQTT
eukprot:2251352-Lingulodinium_polyedra.AAC.1